jgi:hypothetical protein
LHLERAQPTHRLVEKSRLELPYGEIGFRPAGLESQAVGPHAFEVDANGFYLVADPVNRRLVRVSPDSGAVSVIGRLPLPVSDLALDGDEITYLRNQRGDEVVPVAGSPVRVRKCSAEAGLITLGSGSEIKLKTGRALASIRLIGTNAAGDAYLIIETFRQRKRLEVDRQIVVLDPAGVLKARLWVVGLPVVHPAREFVLGPGGTLHRMIPGAEGLALVRWEMIP